MKWLKLLPCAVRSSVVEPGSVQRGSALPGPLLQQPPAPLPQITAPGSVQPQPRLQTPALQREGDG